METKEILLVEDDPRDIELTLTALEAHNLSNKVVVVQDGAEALDYLYRRGEYRPLELDEYVDAVVRFLERLPSRVVIQRVTGEAPRRLTVAPGWSVNKLAVFNAIERELELRDTWQGKALGASHEDLL